MQQEYALKEDGYMQLPLRIAICDDLVSDAAILQELIKQSQLAALCDIFENGNDLLLAFYPARYDIIFIDIYMNGILGIDAVRQIRELDENVIIAFTTSSDSHTLESYRLGVLKYIEKPVTLKPVRETLEMANLKRLTRPYLKIFVRGKETAIPFDHIVYLEQQNHRVRINTIQPPLSSTHNIKLSDIESQLPAPPFLRCHHSFIVNLRYVQKFDKELSLFLMKTGATAYIRRDDIKKAINAYETYLFAAARGEFP